MKIIHIINKLFFFLKYYSLKDLFKNIFFINRKLIVVKKNITDIKPIDTKDIKIIHVDKNNIGQYTDQYNLQSAKYYCKKGASCTIAFLNKKCLGFQYYTLNKNFSDLIKYKIQIKNDEAYLFDFFVYPQYRGSSVPLYITLATFNNLKEKGIKAVYGYYHADNIKSLWWHRAVIKFKEIKKISVDRYLFLHKIGKNIYFA